MYNFRAEKDNFPSTHRNVEYIDVTEDEGVILKFHDGSHTYLDPEMTHYIINEILRITFNENE